MLPGPRSSAPAPTRASTTTTPVTFTLSQVIMGLTQAAWNTQNGNQVYQRIVDGLLSSFAVTVSVTAQSFRRNLQSGGTSSGSVLVTTSITCSPASQSQVIAAMQATNADGISVIAQQLTTISGFSNVRAQAIVQPGVSPTNPPTSRPSPSPTGMSAALAAQNTQSDSTGGLPTTTLIAIVVVLVLVVVAAALVAFRNVQPAKDAKTVVVDPYRQYRNSGRSSGGSFQSVSPAHRRSSFGLTQSHAPRRHSRGDAIEMTDAYRYSDGGTRLSMSETNPGFGSSRLQSQRKTLSRL